MCLHDRAHASHPNAMAPGIAAVLAVVATVRLRWPAQVAGGANAGSRSLRPIALVALGRLRAGRLRDRQFHLGTAGRKLAQHWHRGCTRLIREMLFIFTMHTRFIVIFALYCCSSIGVDATLADPSAHDLAVTTAEARPDLFEILMDRSQWVRLSVKSDEVPSDMPSCPKR
jgi:hypothetical protein